MRDSFSLGKRNEEFFESKLIKGTWTDGNSDAAFVFFNSNKCFGRKIVIIGNKSRFSIEKRLQDKKKILGEINKRSDVIVL